MEIRQAFDISKLNASQPLSGSSHSKTFTKPCNVSTPLTRSPEKDMVSFSGKGDVIMGKTKLNPDKAVRYIKEHGFDAFLELNTKASKS